MHHLKRISIYSVLFTSIAAAPFLAANAQTDSTATAAPVSSMTSEDCADLPSHKSEFSAKEYKKRARHCKHMTKKHSHHKAADDQTGTPGNTNGTQPAQQ